MVLVSYPKGVIQRVNCRFEVGIKNGLVYTSPLVVVDFIYRQYWLQA
jgi:hypothetical protein